MTLGLIVEEITGKTLSQFIHDNIFKPLDMRKSVAYDKRSDDGIANRALGTSKRNSTYITKDQSYASAVLGDGGIYTSLDDFYKWDKGLYNDVLVSKASLEEAYTPPKYLDFDYDNYTCGWFFRKNADNQLEQLHDGGTQGFTTYYMRGPDKKQSIIILSNRNIAESVCDTIPREIRKIYDFADMKPYEIVY